MGQPHPNGTKVKLTDRRFDENQPAIILDNRNYPLYQVRLGLNSYDTKQPTHIVSHSKLALL